MYEEIIAEIERQKKELVWGACAAQIEMETNCKAEASDEVLTFINSLLEEKPSEDLEKGCGMEFPHFGARYPDACCINGYLWDLDSYEEGLGLTSGGDDPCPFCNTKEWLEDVVGSIFATEAEALEWVEKMRVRYGQNKEGAEHLRKDAPSEDLEKDAMAYYLADTKNSSHYTEDGHLVPRAINDAYIAGRLAQKEQMILVTALVNESRDFLSLSLSTEEYAKIGRRFKGGDDIEIYIKQDKK